MKLKFRWTMLALVAGALIPVTSDAQDNGFTTPGDFGRSTQGGGPVWNFSLDGGYDTAGAAKFDGVKLADSDAFNYKARLGVTLPLAQDWFLTTGLASDNFSLQAVAGAPIPVSINTARVSVGLGYRFTDQFSLTALVSPSLFRDEDFRSDDIGISGGLLARYRQSPNLIWSFGLFAAPDSDIPVVPVAGVRWRINDKYTLDVGMPNTRLTYRLDSKWSLYAGADLNGTVFRTSGDLGAKTGFPAYNNAIAVYRDVRVGAGISYDVARNWRLEAEGGYSVFREINYFRIDNQVRFDPSAYARLGLSYRF